MSLIANTKDTVKLQCVLCEGDILPEDNETSWDQGYNIHPFENVGWGDPHTRTGNRCCYNCDQKVVTPLRLINSGYSIAEIKDSISGHFVGDGTVGEMLAVDDEDIHHMVTVMWREYQRVAKLLKIAYANTGSVRIIPNN